MAEADAIIGMKDAIDRGFELFADAFPDNKFSNILLEGLEFLESDEQWKVTIGFDAGRKISDPRTALMGFGAQEVREGRSIFINATNGAFVKMDKG